MSFEILSCSNPPVILLFDEYAKCKLYILSPSLAVYALISISHKQKPLLLVLLNIRLQKSTENGRLQCRRCISNSRPFQVVELPATSSSFRPFMTLMLSVRQRVYPVVQLPSGLGFISVFSRLKVELLFSPLGNRTQTSYQSLDLMYW